MVEIVPMIHLHRGNIVNGSDGAILSKKPLDFLKVLFKKFDKALLFDIDGIKRNKPHWKILRKLETKEVWVDAGVRSSDGIYELFVCGASSVVLSTAMLRGPKELEESVKLSDNIIVRIGLEETDSMVEGAGFRKSLRAFLDDLKNLGIRRIIFSGAPDTIYLTPKTIEEVLRQSLDFDAYLILKDENEKDRLEGRGIKGIVTEVDLPGSSYSRHRLT
jgi:phosphoribosylformimino-5-aminoimidazole carboxamide ribonucleotide (ProFAR) isomerase